MAIKIKWSELTEEQIKVQLVAGQEELTRRETSRSRLAAVRNEVQALLNKEGLTLDDVLPMLSEKPAKAKVAAKYANPDNSEETWTGRGRTPLWLQAALDSGKSLADFLIPII